MSGCLSSEEEKAAAKTYQAEFDKILPLSNGTEIDGIYPTETEGFGEYLIIRGKIEKVHKEVTGDSYRYHEHYYTTEYDIIFSDDRKLYSLKTVGVSGECSVVYMEGEVNRIVIYKSNSHIKEITY